MAPTTVPEFSDGDMSSMLARWLPDQRWFAAKGRTIRSVHIALRAPLARTSEFAADHLLVSVRFDSGPDQLYQVPLGYRPHRRPFDAMADPEIVALYAQALSAGTGVGPVDIHLLPGTVIEPGVTARASDAEQSNTSVVFGERWLMKMFRRITAGVNPDVELHLALGTAGSSAVAPLRAWMDIDWDGTRTTLAMVQDFERDAADGWSMAVDGTRDLLDEARRMGSTVAEVHALLAAALGTSERPIDAIVDEMLTRLDAAARVVPELARLAPAIRDRVAEAHRARTVVQRVHGDLHLGQMLRTPDRWLLIDFEGEPATSLDERRRPDSVLRDVAGMLRSFDYAASQGRHGPGWAGRHTAAFCDGYARTSGTDPRDHGALLRAYELDKAVYEVLYETHHRPRWVEIPLGAIRRLIDRDDD